MENKRKMELVVVITLIDLVSPVLIESNNFFGVEDLNGLPDFMAEKVYQN